MKTLPLVFAMAAAILGTFFFTGATQSATNSKVKPVPAPRFTWTTVVNNNDLMPGASPTRNFNSYNQPAINKLGVVVFRARSRGGEGQGLAQGEPVRGICLPRVQ